MKLQFQLSEEDFLNFQLFMASQSTAVRKRRAKGKFFMLLIYMALGIWIWSSYGTISGGLFFLVCLPLYFLYAWMDRRQFVQHFRKYIQTQLQDQLKNPVTLDMESAQIRMSYNQNESVIPMADIQVIHEIPTLVILLLQGGQSIIIPRPALTGSQADPAYFKQLAEAHQLTYNHQPAWKWK